MNQSKIEVVVEVDENGMSAYAVDYPVATTAESKRELMSNILEALNFYFEDHNRVIYEEDIKLTFTLNDFFKAFSYLNTSVLADRIGMNKSLLSQYVSGKKKPSQDQLNKIVTGIQTIGKELAQTKLTI